MVYTLTHERFKCLKRQGRDKRVGRIFYLQLGAD